MSNKQKYYLVVRGRQPGLYRQWQGADGAQAQVDGFPNALYRSFATLDAARDWAATLPPDERAQAQALLPAEIESVLAIPTDTSAETVIMYTDGSAIGNPGPGGYGVVLRYNSHYKELSGGFRLTTNNRMELMACIAGLRALKRPMAVIIHSDSAYVVNAMRKGWARRWQAQNWMRTESEPVKNADLWAELLQLCEYHQVEFVRVPGHSGVPDNERCHALAIAAAQQADLPPDEGFVAAS
ncbi:MAG: ribonuclease HI [Chloroflexus sp.]|nr:ribonuclease HI [Chloroflexus sp.]